MNRRLLILSLLALPCLTFGEEAINPSPSTYRITEDDRDVMLGFEAAKRLALAPIEARQRAYLERLAGRLKIPPQDLAEKYQFNLEALTVEPISKPKPRPSP